MYRYKMTRNLCAVKKINSKVFLCYQVLIVCFYTVRGRVAELFDFPALAKICLVLDP